MKIFLSFLAKIKADVKQLFGYPRVEYGEKMSVDYEVYWRRRRGKKEAFFSSWQRQRADITLKIIEPNSRVIDLGCGDGATINYLQEHSHIHGIGVDINLEMLKKASTLGVKTIQMDINNLESIKTLPEVDYILGFEIIEHMPCPESLIYHLLDKAKKGLVFSVPNTGYYSHRLRLLFGKFPLQWAAHPGEHLRFWTVKDMKFWLKSIGVKSAKIILYEGLPILNKIFPSLFAQGIIVYFKK